MTDWPCFEVQVTLRVKAISAAHANQIADHVLTDGRRKNTEAYIHYIEDVIQLTNQIASRQGDQER